MQIVETATHAHFSSAHFPILSQIRSLFVDMEGEAVREFKHDNSQSEAVMRKHVMGLILILYSLVTLILLAGVAAIGLYSHPL